MIVNTAETGTDDVYSKCDWLLQEMSEDYAGSNCEYQFKQYYCFSSDQLRKNVV